MKHWDGKLATLKTPWNSGDYPAIATQYYRENGWMDWPWQPSN